VTDERAGMHPQPLSFPSRKSPRSLWAVREFVMALAGVKWLHHRVWDDRSGGMAAQAVECGRLATWLSRLSRTMKAARVGGRLV
jgi:hypothetical protein